VAAVGGAAERVGWRLGLEEWLEGFPDGLCDYLFAFEVGVNAVGLVEGGVAAYAVEEERNEGSVVLCRELGEDIVKGGAIGVAHAWGYAHTGEKYLAGGITVVDGVDDRLEVGLCGFDRNAAKTVVAAEFEDEDVGGLAQGPVEAALSARGCFAADAGVDNLVGQVEGVEAVADEGGEGLIGFEAVARGEGVAEEDNCLSVVGGNGGRDGRDGRGGVG